MIIITGCTVDYDLNIDSDNIDEKVSINLLDDEIDDYDIFDLKMTYSIHNVVQTTIKSRS